MAFPWWFGMMYTEQNDAAADVVERLRTMPLSV